MSPWTTSFLAVAVLVGLRDLPAQPDDNAPEMTARDTPSFSTGVNLVSVPVVVRDRDGHAVGALRKEDFQLFDKGKPQIISRFSIEKTAMPAAVAPIASGSRADDNSVPTAAPSPIALRFVAYLFDDVHLTAGDLVHARDAADLQIARSLDGNTRIAIFTTSGLTTADFTLDRDALHTALLALQPRPSIDHRLTCPDISYYQADLILNKQDPRAIATAILEFDACNGSKPQPGLEDQLRNQNRLPSGEELTVRAVASSVLQLGVRDSRFALEVLGNTVHRMSPLPGTKTLVLVSQGFLLLPEHGEEQTAVMERAAQSNIIINSINARGLFTVDPDAGTKLRGSGEFLIAKSDYVREGQMQDQNVLAELADGTGGTYFHNSNDLGLGFQRLAGPPEFVYTLGFSPREEKLDGSYHALRVTLKNSAVKNMDLTLQTRQGYYAPSHAADPQEEAKRQIQDALFSRDELTGIPIDLQLQYVSLSDTSARLAVLVHLNVRKVRFENSNGRNGNTLTITSALFDTNGNYINAIQKTLDMRLRDQTLQNVQSSGINVRTYFDVAPGSYVVRLVVRDREGQTMAARNGVVEIP